MEGPTDTDEASIPTEPESMTSGTTTTLKRKVCTKTCVTKLTAANILVSPPEEDIPARKKPRLSLQTSLPAIAADADTLNAYASPDAGVAVAVASADAGTDPVAASPMQPNVGAARAPYRRWTPEEDTKLTSAVKAACEKKHGGEYTTDWIAIAVLVPGRTNQQCNSRWHRALDSKNNETTAHLVRWTKEEDVELKDAVEKHNGKNWEATAALVPGRTKIQCTNRWHDVLISKSDDTTGLKEGKWTKEEDSTLTDAVKKHNGKDWAAIAELLPGRTKKQCRGRWHRWQADTQSDETTARAGRWTKEEDRTLQDAVEKHNGTDWAAISELVPGRTKMQSYTRWYRVLEPKSDETSAHVGRWTKEELGKLKDAVEKHNGKNWASIATLVPGRTKQQCRVRWNDNLARKSDETTVHVGKWTKEEDGKLKAAVEKHNGEDWASITALVPGRTKKQCTSRWHGKLRYKSSVEGPTEEASIPTEPNKSMSGTTSTLKRQVCTNIWVTKSTAANIKSSPEEDIPAREKPRLSLQTSLPAIAADADTLNAYASPDAGVAVAVASADAGTDPWLLVLCNRMLGLPGRLIAGGHQKKTQN
jgi:hypothetical protein